MIERRLRLPTLRRAATALAVALCFSPGPLAEASRQGGATTRTAAAPYSCPMHPSVRSESPGPCPDCGMSLRRASEGPETERPDAGAAAPSGPRIPDVELVDQDGRAVRFYSDLVKNRVVVINFIFTTCTTICPPLGATFARVQKDLGDRVGRDVHFISITVDPETDTPERLKAWGAKFHAGAGWTLVTGEKRSVDEVLRALSAATSRPEDHSPIVLVGNDARGQWARTYGLARPSRIVELVDAAAQGRLEPVAREAERK